MVNDMTVIYPETPGDGDGPRLRWRLVDFLHARIGEDEAAARAVEPLGPVYAHYGDTAVESAVELAGGEGAQRPVVDLITRVAEPARVLAECQAKRRIIALHDRCDDWSYGDPASCPELCALAAIYNTHPDYDESWTPR